MMSKAQHLALLVAGLLYGTSATAAELSCAEEPDDASLIQSRSSRKSRNLTMEVEELQGAMNNSILEIGIFRKAQNLECVDVISIFSPTTVYYCKDGNLVFCGKKSDTTCVDFQAPDPCGVATSTTSTTSTTSSSSTTTSTVCRLPLWPANFSVDVYQNSYGQNPPEGVLTEKVFLCKESTVCKEALYLDGLQAVWRNLEEAQAADLSRWQWVIRGHKFSGDYVIYSGTMCFCWLSGAFQVNGLCGCGFLQASAMSLSGQGAPPYGESFSVTPLGSSKKLFDGAALWPVTCQMYLEMQDDCQHLLPSTSICNVQSSCPSGSTLVTQDTSDCTFTSCTDMACVY
ncbi:unnamed protein product [Polarella glacialis]|uniref:Uncharacterized protein n=1 Tax=Polarella glacialis TaxID=89957 RepID=A0A813HCH1_POLGL|nr:unnamed protein product [Polarella glacialis]